MNFLFHSEAEDELNDAIDYYEGMNVKGDATLYHTGIAVTVH